MSPAAPGAEVQSISALVEWRARHSGGAPLLFAPGRPPLSYAALGTLVEEVAQVLAAAGVAPTDRVAVVLPNGPEMASAFLAVTARASCAPLNPGYTAKEFAFYFEDLKARAVIVEAEDRTGAAEVALKLGVRVLRLEVEAGAPAGRFRLRDSEPGGKAQAPGRPGPDQEALVLHTSGTTSRPKIVPLLQRNLCASGRNINGALSLSPADRCLNVMPLFHIHGLVGALLSSVWAGGSVIAAPGFLAPSFFEWMKELKPTWYTAVPTIHQGVLARAGENAEVIAANPLRFLRSSSAPLAPSLMAGLEAAFGAPVVEAFGMTEASHQICCNPLPPRVRKPGSVGIGQGVEVGAMDPDGRLLAPGEQGELVIRGPNVTAGYESNPAANAACFVADRWFRTGDQGHLDQDGYVFITGRLKEIINRAGQKVSPREVDEVLLEHPAVAQAVAFASPHAELGEEVAAAIVLRPGHSATERELRDFAAQKLADYKVPSRVVLVAQIPKGPTGKVQRIGLAAALGLTERSQSRAIRPAYRAPQSPTEAKLAQLWGEVLRVERVGLDDDFFDLGGDSMLAARVASGLRDALGVELRLGAFFDAPKLAAMAVRVLHEQASAAGDMAALLAQLEGLTDEQAAAALEAADKG